MSRLNSTSFKAACFGLMLVILLVLATASAVAADEKSAVTGEGRSSVTMHFKQGGRGNNRDPQKGSESVDQYLPLETDGQRTATASVATGKLASGKESGTQSATLASNDFWVYEADVVLFYDDDGDGYYYGIDLLIDADTIFNAADVYAAVYLSYEGGPWNEYAVTEDFTIFGTSATDEYVLVTELASGYPTGEYDLLIELFDAFDGSFVASYGPSDSSELAFLPLEDFNRDAPGFDRPVTVNRGGGGATGFWLLIFLAAALRRRMNAAAPLA